MIRFAAILLLLLTARAFADPAVRHHTLPRFDAPLATKVYTAAFHFMEPRTLEPVTVPQLTQWGLRGLTALDPDLTTDRFDGKLRLLVDGHVLFTEVPPRGNAAKPWATAAVRLSDAAVHQSPMVRRVGTTGVVQSFFDELFNHLDPYSRYVAPQDAAADRAERNGRAGLGLTLMLRDHRVQVRAAVEDGPGAAAGIRPGDTIISVDGHRVAGLSVDGHRVAGLSVDGHRVAGEAAATVARLMAGAEDTGVQVTWRTRHGRVHAATMQRAMVPPETVFADRQHDMLLVRVTGFSHSTAAHLHHALADGMGGKHPPAGIVLDLRDNRGGLLDQAVAAADTLLPSGVVAYTVGRDLDANHIWRSDTGQLAEDVPVVVLVDGRTASAAEVLTAALTDRGRAVAVGSATLGKGLVQTIAPMPDGGELFVTWSRILAPRGWPIQGLGVLPQVCTSLGTRALQQQLTALGDGTQPMAAAIDAQRAVRAPLPAATMVALRRACPAAGGSELDMKVAQVLIDNPIAYAAALLPPLQDTASAK